MKKLLFLATALVFLAAACNSQQSTGSPSSQSDSSLIQTDKSESTNQTPAQNKVDAAVSSLFSELDSEDSISTQSDSNVINSDQALINSYSGAVNENSF